MFKLEKSNGYQIHRGKGFLRSSVGKESACNAGDLGSVPKSGRSPGEGNGNPLQYSCLENPTDRGAWRVSVRGVARVRHDLATEPPPKSSSTEVILRVSQCPQSVLSPGVET